MAQFLRLADDRAPFCALKQLIAHIRSALEGFEDFPDDIPALAIERQRVCGR
jgi:hypothetical protein